LLLELSWAISICCPNSGLITITGSFIIIIIIIFSFSCWCTAPFFCIAGGALTVVAYLFCILIYPYKKML